jgi:hypothetical protein
MSGGIGIDLGTAEHDEPITELAERVQGVRSIVQAVIDNAPAGRGPFLPDRHPARAYRTWDRTTAPREVAYSGSNGARA